MPSRKLSAAQRTQLLAVVQARFERHMHRHQGAEWSKVQSRLDADSGRLWSLHEMERTGGEPDVVDRDAENGEFIFIDCSAQSPKGRRSVCYDQEALEARKEHKPADSATNLAAAIGIELLTEEAYRKLQQLGEFDTTTSSWFKTPTEIRKQAVPSTAIVATTPSSCTTTVQNRTMPPAGSAARSGFEALSRTTARIVPVVL